MDADTTKTPKKAPVRKTAAAKAGAGKTVSRRKPSRASGAAAPESIETAPAQQKEAQAEPDRYWEAVGRRKTAVARIRLFTKGDRGVWVNAKPIAEYFVYNTLQRVATEAIDTMNSNDRFRVSAKVSGGGTRAQAEAIRHGTARALVLFNPDFRKRLKRAGFLTRDPRMKERKKFGLKGARKAPQWAKR